MSRLDARLQELERRQPKTEVRQTKAYRDAIVAAALRGEMPSLVGLNVQRRAALEAACRADL